MANVTDFCLGRHGSCYATEGCVCECHDKQKQRPQRKALNWSKIVASVGALCVSCATGMKCATHKPPIDDTRI